MKPRSKKLNVFKTMPPLFHKLPNQPFNKNDSQLYQWIVSQPDILEWVRSRAIGFGYIKYDSETGKWAGVDYQDDN